MLIACKHTTEQPTQMTSRAGKVCSRALSPIASTTFAITTQTSNNINNKVRIFVSVNLNITFTIEEGDATFSNAQKSITLTTDKSRGWQMRAATRPIMGAAPSTVIVTAGVPRLSRAANEPATIVGAGYQITVLAQQDGPTRFTGKVLDHTGTPLSGVRVSIGRTSLNVATDIDGNFTFADLVPPGRIDLFIDGRTAAVTNAANNKQYPSLHFEALAIRGQNNVLPHAIHLPPLLTSQTKIVGGTADVTLTIPGYEGFAMIVKANSVTFPDGAKVGSLVVSPVLLDKLPMAPTGAIAAPAWTIQPTGTRFDPPIEVRLPNSQNLKPGEQGDVFQWDHELATFVPMGRGTVSEDGALMVTDAGSGITKAGWGWFNPWFTQATCAVQNLFTCRDCLKRSEAPICACSIPKDESKPCDDNICKQCTKGVCEPKLNEAETITSVSEITFLPPLVTKTNCRAEPSPDGVVRLPLGCFRAFYSSDENAQTAFSASAPKSEAAFRLGAYCDGKGSWKFKLTAAKWQTVIAIRPLEKLSTDTKLLTNDVIETIHQINSSKPNTDRCNHLWDLRVGIRCTAESHLGKGCRVDRQYWYTTESAVLAHELVHFTRFKTAVNAKPFADFLDSISKLTLPIASASDSNAAVRKVMGEGGAFKFTRQQLWTDSRAASIEEATHPAPEDYTNAALENLDSFITKIGDLREQLGCKPKFIGKVGIGPFVIAP